MLSISLLSFLAVLSLGRLLALISVRSLYESVANSNFSGGEILVEGLRSFAGAPAKIFPEFG